MDTGTEPLFIVVNSHNQPSISTQRLILTEMPGSRQINLDNVADFSNVCRVCASSTEFIIPIFEGEGLQNNLAEKIHKHLPIKVSPEDVLPRVVCYQCASTVLAWHELVQCATQADAALRARQPAPPTTQEQNPINIKSSSSVTEEETQSKLFNTGVRHALVEYFGNNLDDELDVEFVCQLCEEKPALTTVPSLAEHMRYDHSDLHDDKAIKTFITNHITFEQVLDDNSDRETKLDTKDKSVIPSLYCPFCTSVFSSATRLVYHLNKHVEVCIDAGVMCCDFVYNDKKRFVNHLQEAHVNITKNDAAPAVCVSCSFIADDKHKLKTHYLEAHDDSRREKIKKDSPNNQKYIPAVCPECNKTFSNKYNMFVHMKSHSRTQRPLYTCDKCDRTYRTKGNLTHHKKVAHEGILRFLCAECGEAFPTRAARDVHARLHSGRAPHRCALCGRAYRAAATLRRHLDAHRDVRNYPCPLCAKKFRKKSHLDYHVNTHNKLTARPEQVAPRRAPPRYRSPPRCPSPPRTSPLRCPLCHTLHPSSSYQTHLVSEHSEHLFHCGECNQYIERKYFIRHMAVHAEQYSFEEVKTEKQQKLKKEVKSEQVDINQNTNEPLQQATPVVNETTRENQQNEFSDHSDMEYGFGPLPESVFEAIEDTQDSQPDEEGTSPSPENCNMSEDSNHVLPSLVKRPSRSVPPGAANNRNLAMPAVRSAHENNKNQSENDGRKTRTCPICSKVYRASSSYFYHINTHKDNKDHECDICKRKFKTKANLLQHAPIHTGECRYECKECKKRFKSKASLYIHEQSHKGVVALSCKQCQRSFRWKTHLARHMSRHAAERAHVCATCGRGFAVRGDLARHVRTHSAGSFACDKCGVQFAQLRYLKVHINKKHAKKSGKKSH